VTIGLPTADVTSNLHDFSGWPPTSTVQAPQTSMPQPYLVPVRPIRSRRTQSSGISLLETVTV
jgi:hypothetical protein